jgi:hypothetical protein
MIAISVAERSKDIWAPRAVQRLSAAFGELKQFDRARVLNAIRNGSRAHAWLARLATIAQASDLAFLDALFSQLDQPAKRAWLITAATRVPGAQAQALLEDWFDRYEDLDVPIALHLVLRPDVDKHRLLELRDRFDDRPASAILDLALGHSDVMTRLSRWLHSDNPQQRYAGALAIKVLGGPEYRSLLWLNAGYQDDRYYPSDVKLRNVALSALVDVELNRFQRQPPGKEQRADQAQAKASTYVFQSRRSESTQTTRMRTSLAAPAPSIPGANGERLELKKPGVLTSGGFRLEPTRPTQAPARETKVRDDIQQFLKPAEGP